MEPGPHRRQRNTGSWVWKTSSWGRLRDGEDGRAATGTIAHREPRTGPLTEPFTGQPTSVQMMGLRELQYLAEVQGSVTTAALVPLREGRRDLFAAVRKNRKRLLIFTANGGFVFLAGLALQVALIHVLGMSHDLSYVIQTVCSVQLNFLLSRYLTWRDRRVAFFGSLAKFTAQQLASTGLGVAIYAGLEKFGMNYIAANVAVTAVLTPVSFLVGHNWSMSERASTRVRFTALPWPLFGILVVQALLSLRLVWANTAFHDEAIYLYVGSQELNHWIHGTVVENYQTFLSGAPVVYPPLAAIVNAVGGLVAARLLSLCFMLGATSLLYVTARRILDGRAAVIAASLFVALGGTQFLGAFATYDAMGLFLLVLSAYLVVGRENTYDTLTDVACSTVVAAAVLALANADKYATALWDPVVVGLALVAPPVAGYPWRYGIGRALRFAVTLALFLGAGLAVGKAKYIQGIMSTTVNRSSSQAGMGQPASLVLHEAWGWIGVVIVLAAIGALLAFVRGRDRSRVALTGSFVLMMVLLAVASILAPLSQARIGTTVSLQKHVIFGAWFGCIVAGYALSRLLRYRVLVGFCACAIIFGLATFNAATATGFFQWPTENMAFIDGLKELVKPGNQRYLIEGYDDIPAYYVGDVSAIQWEEAGAYSYTDPQTGKYYVNGPAFADAIKHRVFTLIILNFTSASSNEPADDYLIVNDIAKYGGYQVIAHLPPSDSSSDNYYTVWRVTGR